MNSLLLLRKAIPELYYYEDEVTITQIYIYIFSRDANELIHMQHIVWTILSQQAFP